MHTVARFALALFLVGSGIVGLSAETPKAAAPAARLDFADKPALVTLTPPKDKAMTAKIGQELAAGWSIKTGATTAELSLIPNGTKIRLAANTTLTIDSLQAITAGKDGKDAGGAGTNGLNLEAGKIRVLAAKLVGGSYSVKTPSAVCGVRGTDFARDYNPKNGMDWVCVTEGKVNVTSTDGKATVDVGAGNFVDLLKGYKATPADKAWVAKNFADLDFSK